MRNQRRSNDPGSFAADVTGITIPFAGPETGTVIRATQMRGSDGSELVTNSRRTSVLSIDAYFAMNLRLESEESKTVRVDMRYGEGCLSDGTLLTAGGIPGRFVKVLGFSRYIRHDDDVAFSLLGTETTDCSS